MSCNYLRCLLPADNARVFWKRERKCARAYQFPEISAEISFDEISENLYCTIGKFPIAVKALNFLFAN